jgi:hypothetical protein
MSDLRAILATHSPTITEDGFDRVCAACEEDWPCEQWDETFTPGTIGELLDERDALRASLKTFAPQSPSWPACSGKAVGRAAPCGLGSMHGPHLYRPKGEGA